MLHICGYLRERGAQISSAIEEDAVILHIEQKEAPLLHVATRHWILNWEDEGFSKELADKIEGELLIDN